MPKLSLLLLSMVDALASGGTATWLDVKAERASCTHQCSAGRGHSSQKPLKFPHPTPHTCPFEGFCLSLDSPFQSQLSQSGLKCVA